MNKVITEDIISRALNESIDEFMLEEDMINEKWGDALKGVWNGLKKTGNWVKNAAAMYMDRETNGQWNNKYGIYANGSGKTTEMYYLNKWFNTHLKNIQQIEYRNNTPNADFSRSREYVERNGERVYTDTEIQEKDIVTYVQKNITPNNFNLWVSNFIKDRQALSLIDEYIKKCCSNITDLRTAMKWLNTWSFMADKDTGQVYLQTKQGDLRTQRKEYELKAIETLIPRYQKWFYDNFNNSNTNEWKADYQRFLGNRTIPKNLITFISNIVNYSIEKQNQKVLKLITYENFIRNYGKYYK